LDYQLDKKIFAALHSFELQLKTYQLK